MNFTNLHMTSFPFLDGIDHPLTSVLITLPNQNQVQFVQLMVGTDAWIQYAFTFQNQGAHENIAFLSTKHVGRLA